MTDPSTPSHPARPGRLLSLDIVRAAAILFVLVGHVNGAWLASHPLLLRVGHMAHRGGWSGVDLFFVLSGFLVSGLLFREFIRHGNVRTGQFLIRRGFKIYPPFWVFLLATVWFDGLYLNGSAWDRLLAEFLFVQNYFRGLWIHTWSLAVEEHFYLLLALVVGLAARFGRRETPNPFRATPALTLSLLVLCPGARLLAAHGADPASAGPFFATHLRLDALAAGVLVAYGYHFHQRPFLALCRRWRIPLLVAGAAPYAALFALDLPRPFVYTFGYSLLSAGGALAICGMLGGSLPRTRGTVLLGSIGAHSYSIYLWHLAIDRWLPDVPARFLGAAPDSLWNVPVFLVGSIALGIGMSRVVEWPILRLRDRMWPSRSRPLGSPDPGSDTTAPARETAR